MVHSQSAAPLISTPVTQKLRDHTGPKSLHRMFLYKPRIS